MPRKKEFLSNLLGFGIVDILGLLIPLLTMPILSRALGSSAYGELLLCMTILIFGHTIIDYGSHFTGVREVARNRELMWKVRYLYKTVQGLRIILATIYYLIICCYVTLFDLGALELIIYVISPLYLLGYALTPIWFFQGMGLASKALIISLLAKLFHLFYILLLVRSPEDLYKVVLSLAVPIMLSGFYLSFLCNKLFAVGQPTYKRFFKDIKLGSSVFVGLLAPNLYNSLPIILLGTIYPPIEFAKFAVASKLITVIITIQNTVAKSVYSIVTQVKYDVVYRLIFIYFFITVIPVAVLYYYGNEIINIFLGEEFGGANEYLLILALGAIFLGMSNAITKGFILPNGLDKIYRNISIRVSVFSTIISTYLIYNYGLLGGAVSLTCARILLFSDYFCFYLKTKNSNTTY